VTCIGPKTPDTTKRLGLSVHIVPRFYTILALVEIIVKYVQERTSPQKTQKDTNPT
jgi:uroporphyrinogen-III synthase